MKNIVITGVTKTGNMGGVAMLKTSYAEMSKIYPEAEFSLLSITPNEDRVNGELDKIDVVSASPFLLMGIYLPLSLLFWPFWRMGLFRSMLRPIPYFSSLLDADLIIDLCGIAFVDKRGLPLLLYNIACCIPAIALGVPVAKLSQALGPFNNKLNRWAAKQVLNRCALVVGRGETTGASLSELGIRNACVLPDVTFCLEIPEHAKYLAQEKLLSMGINTSPVIISPSEVVRRLMIKNNIILEKELDIIIRNLVKDGVDIILLPHSFGNGNSKNNDNDLCRRMYKSLAKKPNVHFLDDVREPVLLRAIIGKAQLFIGCRFHAVVAALSMEVPALTIGWSHKYSEMSAMFGLSEWVIPSEKFNAQVGLIRWKELCNKGADIRKELHDSQKRVTLDARRNFELAAKLVE